MLGSMRRGWKRVSPGTRAGGCKPPMEVDRLYPLTAELRGAPTPYSTPYRACRTALQLHPGLGREESAASLGAGGEADRFRLEKVEYGRTLPDARIVQRLQDPVRQDRPESTSSAIGRISLEVKGAGEPGGGNLHARFEVAGGGDGTGTVTAPLLDPTDEGAMEKCQSAEGSMGLQAADGGR